MMSYAAEREVTVVIPAYNAQTYLEETVASVLAARDVLARVLIIDDGSSDGTAQVASRLQNRDPSRVRLISTRNSGVSAARNRGLQEVSDPYVCFLDADDLLTPSSLTKLVQALEGNKQAVAAYGRVGYVNSQSIKLLVKERSRNPRGDLSTLLLSRNLVDTPGAVLFRTRSVLEAGGFPMGVKIGEDWSLYVRVSQLGHILFVNEEVLEYRIHDSSAMSKAPLSLHDFEAAIDDVFLDARLNEKHSSSVLAHARVEREIGITSYLVQRSCDFLELSSRITDIVGDWRNQGWKLVTKPSFWRLLLVSTKRSFNLMLKKS